MIDIIEVRPGMRFVKKVLLELLPDTETVLFFGQAFSLDTVQLSHLMAATHNSTLADALFREGGLHSSELQDYIVDTLGFSAQLELGEIRFDTGAPQPAGEILPAVWESMKIDIAKSIKEVAEKLADVVTHMPGKEGQMVFETMMVANAKRPVLGDHRAKVKHGREPDNLVILDVSGSMTETTVRTIVNDVVAMSYMANAHLAIVSDHATVWGPGEYDADVVLAAAEFSGTHYEELAPLFVNAQWGVVVTIADYDSSQSAKGPIRDTGGTIEQLFDISLVGRPTFLSEVVGQLAKDVRPLLVAANDYCCM